MSRISSRLPGALARIPASFFALVAVCAFSAMCGLVSGCGRSGGGSAAAPARSLRIGHQKADALSLLQLRGDLDKRLAAEGVKVEWLDFPAGPALIEAMRSGSVDLGITGESPAIFAQASGVPLVYLANIQDTTDDGDGLALLVPKNSPVKAISDLKGKRIAVARGSTAHNFLAQILQRAGIDYKDVTPAYLSPPDARAAFDGDQVDAWAVWDPYLNAAQQANGARILVNAKGVISPGSFFLTIRGFAASNPALLKTALEETDKTIAWQKANADASAELLSKSTGIDKPTLLLLAREHGRLRPITDKMLAEQQQVADNFLKLGLVPKPVDVRAGALTPAQYGAIMPAR